MPGYKNQKGVREATLVRRAHHLERRMGQGVVPGRQYDEAEYDALLWVFDTLKIKFTPADTAPVCALSAGSEEPPVLGFRTPGVRGDETIFVPGEPRRARYVPGGL